MVAREAFRSALFVGRVLKLLAAAGWILMGQSAEANLLGTCTTLDRSMVADIATVSGSTTDSGTILNRVVSLNIAFHHNQRDADLPIDVSQLTFDARMPRHDHGMVTLPVVVKISPDTFRVDGVKFHMAGLWDVTVKAISGNTPVVCQTQMRIYEHLK